MTNMGGHGMVVTVRSLALRICRLASRSRLFCEALHGAFVQPLGMDVRAGEFIAQAFDPCWWFIGLGIWCGELGGQQQDADEHQQGVENRLRHESSPVMHEI